MNNPLSASLRFGWVGEVGQRLDVVHQLLIPAMGADFQISIGSPTAAAAESRAFFDAIDVLIILAEQDADAPAVSQALAGGIFLINASAAALPDWVASGQGGLHVGPDPERLRAAMQWCARNVDAVRAGGARNARRDLDLVILDDIFPLLISAFRVAEYNQYLSHFPSSLVLSTGASFAYLSDRRSLAQVRDEYELHHPAHRGRVQAYDPAMLGRAKLAYTIFINNAYDFCEALEQHQVPFVFCLYPGGGFVIDGAESDRKLRRVFASPCFRKVICTQKITHDYLLGKGLCPLERIEFVFGGVHFPPAADTPPKLRYGVDKHGFDICFVASRYIARGIDKGYDVFVAAAKLLAPRFPDMRFHVVGNFTPQEIDVEELGSGIQFHGMLNTRQLADFYAGMEIILSPNRPFILSPGSFDGFPTGTCVEAGLGGVALFIADPLHLSPFKDGEEIVVIGDDPDDICRRIAAFHAAPDQLHLLAGRGARRLHELYGMDTQMGPRIALLEQCLG